jgi:hypothetical protein
MAAKNSKGPRGNKRGVGVRVRDYFPPTGTMMFGEMQRIAEAGVKGVLVETFKLSELFLGQAVACGLLEVTVAQHGTDPETKDPIFKATIIASPLVHDYLAGKRKAKVGSQVNAMIRTLKDATSLADVRAALAKLGTAKEAEITEAKAEAKKSG